MKNLLFFIFWTILSTAINFLWRYVEAGIAKEKYLDEYLGWIDDAYWKLAGIMGTIVTLLIFFIVNYFWNKTKSKSQSISINMSRLVIFILSLLISGIFVYLFGLL